MRWCPLVYALLALTALACGGDDSYADSHESEIQLDCEQTVACRRSRGGPLGDETESECNAIGREKLNASSDSQRREFEMVFARCETQTACAYVQCTGVSQPYSQLHAEAIRHECTQNINCRIMSGEALPPTAIDDCVIQASVALDMSDEPTRAGFETRYSHCAQQFNCAYTACQ